MWSTGLESNKEIVRKQRRNTSFVSNIYIVRDPENPENEGKVFLFRYGKKIFDKISQSLQPEFKEEQACDPFNLWEGANFKLKIRKVEGQVNYDSSVFESPSPLLDDDKALEAIWKQTYQLQEFLGPKSYKTYAELKRRLDFVLNNKPSKDESESDDESHVEEASTKTEAKAAVKSEAAKPSIKEEKVESKPTSKYGDDDDDDDIPNYFENMGKK